MELDHQFMAEAVRLAKAAVAHGNEPFGAVLVKDGKIVCTNENQIYTRHDLTSVSYKHLFLRHTLIHISPFIVFSLSCRF